MPDESQFMISQAVDSLFDMEPYALVKSEKQALLLPIFNQLHQHHQAYCVEYKNLFDSNDESVSCREELPFLAVRLFKLMELLSVPKGNVHKELNSSGTTAQTPAKIYLDRLTSQRQSKALVKIMQSTLGRQRLPMLIIDSPAVLKDRKLFTARGAGIQGLSIFGRNHTYALDEQMQPNWDAITDFQQRFGEQPVLIFGFTFMVWLHFIQELKKRNNRLYFDQGFLVHSGGWKKLESQEVDNVAFKHQVRQLTGVKSVVNFYGMAEQVGSIFVECREGVLHAPLTADVICRDRYSLKPLENGQQGLLQVLSVLPSSYPGHSILSEDVGRVLGEDDCPCGRKGRYFVVDGRLPKAEIRGCSDTHQGKLV